MDVLNFDNKSTNELFDSEWKPQQATVHKYFFTADKDLLTTVKKRRILTAIMGEEPTARELPLLGPISCVIVDGLVASYQEDTAAIVNTIAPHAESISLTVPLATNDSESSSETIVSLLSRNEEDFVDEPKNIDEAFEYF